MAMRAGDFAAAEKSAVAFDAAMESKVLQRTVAVVKAKAERGNDAAQALLDGCVKLPEIEMGPEEKKFFEGLKQRIETSTTEDRVNFAVFAAAVACEIASKGRGGGKLPEVVMETLFGKGFGILKDKYQWDNPAGNEGGLLVGRKVSLCGDSPCRGSGEPAPLGVQHLLIQSDDLVRHRFEGHLFGDHLEGSLKALLEAGKIGKRELEAANEFGDRVGLHERLGR